MGSKTVASRKPAPLSPPVVSVRIVALVALVAGAMYAARDILPGKKLVRSVLLPKEHYQPSPSDSFLLRDIWTNQEVDQLLALVKKHSYQTAAKDLTSKVEHIGEATPLNSDGSCPHHLLVPNSNHTHCILPSRIDIAQHYFKFGGRAGFHESFKKLSSRLQIFTGFLFLDLDNPLLDPLFRSQKYVDASKSVCHGRTLLDPIQLGIIITLPGQTVASHLDVPWFWGATRFNVPQWLLIAMEQSKLWSHLRLPQTQGVAYLHSWVNHLTDGGGFFYYPNGTERSVVVVPPEFNTALVLDGSTIVHGVDVFRPDQPLPDIDPNDHNELRYLGDEHWELSNGKAVIRQYHTHDLRMSLVWRARCFEDEAEKNKWHSYTDELSVDDIIDTFVNDLQKRGKLSAGEVLPPLDLAQLIIREYVEYPVDGNAWQPYNLCMLPSVLPHSVRSFAASVLSVACA
jgi:hypothetical protein